MSYDIASKVIIERCHGELLRRFLGMDVLESVLLEPAPQETASVRRSDFVVSVTERDKRQSLVLLEVQSRWERLFPLRLLEYRCRHILKEKMDVISCVLLLTPSALAQEVYEDDEVRYRFRIIRIYELKAEDIIAEGSL